MEKQHLMIALTGPMARDLRYIVALHQKTVGTFDYPRGMSRALRTGRALARRGLVRLTTNTPNHSRRWSPTPEGVDYVVRNFRSASDPFRSEAEAKADTVLHADGVSIHKAE